VNFVYVDNSVGLSEDGDNQFVPLMGKCLGKSVSNANDQQIDLNAAADAALNTVTNY
jgi:hypothetical protein